QVVGVGQVELVEAGRAAVEDSEAVAALLYLEEGLHLAVDQEGVAYQAVKAEGVEEQETRRGVEELVAEHDGDVEVREARQPQPGVLVARVELVEVELEAGQALVDVLRGVVDPVVVVPARGQSLPDVAARGMGGGEPGVLHVVEVVVVLTPE